MAGTIHSVLIKEVLCVGVVLYITLFHVAGTMCSVLILGLHPCMPSYLLFVKLFHKSFIIQFVIDKATICHPSDSAYKGCCIACATGVCAALKVCRNVCGIKF